MQHRDGVLSGLGMILVPAIRHVVRSHRCRDAVRGFHPARHLTQLVNDLFHAVRGVVHQLVAGTGGFKVRQVFIHTHVKQARVGGGLQHFTQLGVLDHRQVDLGFQLEDITLHHLARDRVALTQRVPGTAVVVEVGRQTRYGNHQGLHQVLDVVRRVRGELHDRGERQYTVLNRGVLVIQVGCVMLRDGVEHVLSGTLAVVVLGFLLELVEQLVRLAAVLHVRQETRLGPCVRQEGADHIGVVTGAVLTLQAGHAGVVFVEGAQVHFAHHRLDLTLDVAREVFSLNGSQNLLQRFRFHAVTDFHVDRTLEGIRPAERRFVGPCELLGLTQCVEVGNHVVIGVRLEFFNLLGIASLFGGTQFLRLQDRHVITEPLERSVWACQRALFEEGVLVQTEMLHDLELLDLHLFTVGEHRLGDLLSVLGQCAEQLGHLGISLDIALGAIQLVERGVVTPLLFVGGLRDELVELLEGDFVQLTGTSGD